MSPKKLIQEKFQVYFSIILKRNWILFLRIRECIYLVGKM